MKEGDKIKVRLKAKHSVGHGNNPEQVKTIDFCSYYEGAVSWFTFKGGTTQYRVMGDEIYSITGPDRFYEIIA